MKVVNVVGARPNFMKIAPIMRAMKNRGGFKPILVHTGQHYDYSMSKVFFEHLEMPEPDIYLHAGPGSHAQQTAAVLVAFEEVMQEVQPEVVIVVGDVNSTLACALVASKLGIPIAHVEAGLRSFDRTMPEEINRVLTDQLSRFLFTDSPEAVVNLLREGVEEQNVYFVGNVMIDTLVEAQAKAKASKALEQWNLTPREYGLVTLHRPSNVDYPETLRQLVEGLLRVAKQIRLLFPVHPRTMKRLQRDGLLEAFEASPGITLIEPLGYCDFLRLMMEALFVITDSGGIQGETTYLGVPCLTLRENTERPITLSMGTNLLVRPTRPALVESCRGLLAGETLDGQIPELWDGKAAERVVDILARISPHRKSEPPEAVARVHISKEIASRGNNW